MSAAPARSMSARVDVHVWRTVAIAGVEAKASDEVWVLLFHGINRARHDPTIRPRYAAIAIGIDHHVGRVSILMPAVACGPLHVGVVRRSSKSRVDVQGIQRIGRHATHSRHLGNDELQLVEKPRIERHILRPHIRLIVVRDEVAEPEVFADWEVNLVLLDLQKPLRGILMATQPFGQVCANSVAIQEARRLFGEGNQDSECRFGHALANYLSRVRGRKV